MAFKWEEGFCEGENWIRVRFLTEKLVLVTSKSNGNTFAAVGQQICWQQNDESNFASVCTQQILTCSKTLSNLTTSDVSTCPF